MVTPMDAAPATVGEADSNSTLGSLLDKVTINAAGTENPDGTRTESVLLPADPGRNPLAAPACPARIVTGETVIVPTPVSELFTLTLTGGTPVMAATACSW